jgi:hypothetical protein
MPVPYALHLESTHAVLGLFERGVFSSRIGMIKPEPALFAQAATAFERAPSSLLLLDDNETNVKAAIALGWSAIRFENAGPGRARAHGGRSAPDRSTSGKHRARTRCFPTADDGRCRFGSLALQGRHLAALEGSSMRTPTRPTPHPLRLLVLSSLLFLWSCGGGDDDGPAASECQAITDTGTVTVGSGVAGDPAAPEPASGYKTGKKVVTSKTYMVVTANPYASRTGCDVLKAGGTAVDAAVACRRCSASSSRSRAASAAAPSCCTTTRRRRSVDSYDGRETAPAAATPNHLRWIDDATDQTVPKPNARASGRSIGTPGAIRMLDLAHKAHGKTAWKDLMQPGIKLATDGFPISGRLAAAIEGARTNFLADAEATSTYLNADLTPKALGTTLTIPAYAATLTALANGGADALYTGPIAQAIVDKINITVHAQTGAAITPGKTTLADPRRLPGQAPRGGLHDLPRLLGLRDGTAVVGRHHRRVGARRARELQPGSLRAERRSTSKAASRRCSASTSSARPSGWPTPTATSTSPTPTSWRCPAAPGTRC